MFQTEPFLNQPEAREYVDAIEEPTEQLLMRVLHNGALGFLWGDPVFRGAGVPFDQLTFVRAAHSVLSRTDDGSPGERFPP